MNQTILAVDDEPHMLMLLERILRERTHYELVATSNSLELPALLESRSFDLIICDLRMPGMDGLDILRWVDEHNRHEAIVLITAFGSADDAAEAKLYGLYEYLNKPFRKEQLLAAVQAVMTWQAARREAETNGTFDRDTFESAPHNFQLAWIKRMVRRHGDAAAVSKHTGVPIRMVENLLPAEAGGSAEG
jgi:DNA-binding NtrC family response regulator